MQHTTRHSVCFHLFHVGFSLSQSSPRSPLLSLSSSSQLLFLVYIFSLNMFQYIGKNFTHRESECLIHHMQYNYAICLDTMCSATHRRYVVVVYCRAARVKWNCTSIRLLFGFWVQWCCDVVAAISITVVILVRARGSLLKVERFFFLHPFIALVVLCRNQSQRADNIHIFIWTYIYINMLNSKHTIHCRRYCMYYYDIYVHIGFK